MLDWTDIDYYGLKAELIGTAAITYVGGWSWINLQFGNCTIGEVGATHFLAYALFSWSAAFISGAHFNPALTTMLYVFNKIKLSQMVFYIISQVLASLLAASMLKLITPQSKANILRNEKFIGFSDAYGDGGLWRWITIIIYEALGVMFVTIVFYIVTLRQKKQSAIQGFSMGATYGALTISMGGLTGGAFNPAKVIGPGVVGKNFLPLVPYLAGEFAGAICGALLCELLGFAEQSEELENELDTSRAPRSVAADLMSRSARSAVGDGEGPVKEIEIAELEKQKEKSDEEFFGDEEEDGEKDGEEDGEDDDDFSDGYQDLGDKSQGLVGAGEA